MPDFEDPGRSAENNPEPSLDEWVSSLDRFALDCGVRPFGDLKASFERFAGKTAKGELYAARTPYTKALDRVAHREALLKLRKLAGESDWIGDVSGLSFEFHKVNSFLAVSGLSNRIWDTAIFILYEPRNQNGNFAAFSSRCNGAMVTKAPTGVIALKKNEQEPVELFPILSPDSFNEMERRFRGAIRDRRKEEIFKNPLFHDMFASMCFQMGIEPERTFADIKSVGFTVRGMTDEYSGTVFEMPFYIITLRDKVIAGYPVLKEMGWVDMTIDKVLPR